MSIGSLGGRGDLYCIRRGARMNEGYYLVRRHIKVKGNTAYDEAGNELSTNKVNGKISYILSKNQGYGKGWNSKIDGITYQNYLYSAGQIALYRQINTFFKINKMDGWISDKNPYDATNDFVHGDNRPGANRINEDAEVYAQNIGNAGEGTKVQNNTNQNNITVESYTWNDGKMYTRVGPFNFTFPGSLKELYVEDQKGNKINPMWISVFNGLNEKYINPKDITSGENFYITVRNDANITAIKAIGGILNLPDNVLKTEIWLLENKNSQNLLLSKTNNDKMQKDFRIDFNINLLGKIGIEKVDANNNKLPLSDVEFIIKNVATGKYISSTGSTVGYTDNEGNAKVFKTDKNGRITVENVIIGKYQFIEKKNPHYGYEVDSTPIDVWASSDTVKYKKVTNKQKYVKISGYVWEDIQSSKQSVRNNRYQEGSADNADKKVKDVRVMLKNRAGSILKETRTDSNGNYLFVDVEIDQLSNYYIEFEYDGLIYENVPYDLSNFRFPNASKSSERGNRKIFNDKFASVNAKNENSVSAKNDSGVEQFEIKYNLNKSQNKASLAENYCPILSNTEWLGEILDIAGKGIETISNINLGIYKRRQADLALMQDLDQVKVGIKGFEHIYRYASRFKNSGEPVDGAWNVGVKFRGKYGENSYLRPVYKSDYEYIDENNHNNELTMFLTYKIVLRNEADIISKVNSISDYFDERYTVNAVGTGINEKTSEITGKLPYKDISKGRVDIDTSSLELNPQKGRTRDIYIQFKLSRENIQEVVGSNNKNLKNVAEINSYTSYDSNGGYYAAVDMDSVPGNKDYNLEDDMDSAPNVGLTIAEARVITGMVFEDNYDKKLLEKQNIREGNGKYDAREAKIGGVKVQLLEVLKDGKLVVKTKKDGTEISTITNDKGEYKFENFEPGNYIVRFIWGDGTQGIYKIEGNKKKTYNNVVEDYKATVFDEGRYNKEKENTKYYQEANINQTHAIDNWETRMIIDKEQNSHGQNQNNGYNYLTDVKTRQMFSDAVPMSLGVEFGDKELIGNITLINGQVKFEVKNISLGLIERPKQRLDFEKRVSNIKIKLQDGRVLVDANIVDDGKGNRKLEGITNYVTYMKPTNINGIRSKGFVKIEMDAELMQTSDLEVEYEFNIINTSEADYASQGFYNHGNAYYTSRGIEFEKSNKAKDVVKLTPLKLVDYLDVENVFKGDNEKNKENKWKEIKLEELKKLNLVDTKNVIDNQQWNKDVNIYMTNSVENKNLKDLTPKYFAGTELINSGSARIHLVGGKTLATNDNINFINQVEIVEINKPFGSKINCVPGNYKPNSGIENISFIEMDTAVSEQVKVMPSTGGNGNVILIVTLTSIALLAVLGVGIILIKKKVIKK